MSQTNNDSLLIKLPDKRLRQRSKKVSKIDAATNSQINDMIAATLDWEASREHEVGVALAAVQIGSLTRVVIVRKDFNHKSDNTFSVFVNPRITKKSGEIVEDYEGCLSIHDLYGKVPRHNKVTVVAQNEKGEHVKIEAEGFLARAFQHEIDHTNGTVFIDHIKHNPDAFYKLDAQGHLEALNYDDVQNNSLLW